ncbi:MAG: glycosyltransferase family 87 protein [Xanthobacteraceae bacterium]
MRHVLVTLRTGDWLTRERIRLITFAVLFASVLAVVWLIATASGLNDFAGRPLGTDFSNVYAAGQLVLDGRAYAAFDPVQQYARERAIFGETTPFYGWHYPPFFLLLAAPLAAMPYPVALGLWQAITLLLYLISIATIIAACKGTRPDAQSECPPARASRSWWLLPAVAFPGVLVNLGHGHNGFLTAALLGGALVQLDRRPLLAGMLFGLLAYKPQFALLIPLVLVATGRWRTIMAAAVTLALLVLITTLSFGPQVWHAFVQFAQFTRAVVLEQGDTGWHKIQTVFSWARMWGGTVPFAYAAQASATALLAISLVWLWRSRAPFPLQAAGLLLGSLLATPYSLDYDMMALAPAIAFLAADGLARGFAPYQKTVLAVLWIIPLIARSMAQATFIPVGVIAMGATFVLVMIWAERVAGSIARSLSALRPVRSHSN